MSAGQPRLPLPEFIALIAMNFAMVAFSIDAMLPALPEIAAEISPEDRNAAQLVLTSFVLGMGVGTLFAGPLSDRFGRKPVIYAGVALYLLGAALAGLSADLEQMLGARVVQGLGVAAPRIVTIAIVRDLYEGRRMAQILSYAMMIFTLVPAIAPFLGAFIIDAFGWRMIFASFILFCLAATLWLALRQPETLPPERRRAITPGDLWQATRACFSHRVFTISCLVQSGTFGMLFGALSTTQQLFDQTYGRGDSFPAWFAMIALIAGTASILNARLVLRLGMQRMVALGLGGQALLAATVAFWTATGALPFWAYVGWTTSIFFMVGFVIGNLNAMAMEPLGAVAGLAASVMGAVATILGAGFAAPLGLAYDGTALPLALGVAAVSAAGLVLTRFGLRAGPVRQTG